MTKSSRGVPSYIKRPIFTISGNKIIKISADRDGFFLLNPNSKDGILLKKLRFEYFNKIMNNIDVEKYLQKCPTSFNNFHDLKKSERAGIIAILRVPSLDRWYRSRSIIRKHL